MLIAVLLVALLWLLQLFLAFRVASAIPPVSLLPRPPADIAWPRLSIVVPARDEGAGIEAALRSKLSCGYPALEVVAIDDRSTDATGEIVDRLAAADARLRAVHIDALPEGWLGKMHAIHRGLSHVTGDWVLLSDADVHLAPGALEKIVAYAESERADIVAVFPQMHAVSPIVDAGVASLLRIFFLPGRIWKSNDDRSSVAAGVGAFNLVRRATLERTRAISELRMEIADDVALAALIKHNGGRCRLLVGRGEVHMTFLDSIAASARSATKAGGIFRWSPWVPLIAMIAPLVLDLGIPLAAIISGHASAGLLALGLATLTHLVLALHVAAPIGGVLLWPLGAVMNAFLMGRSGIRGWRDQGVWWRGTFYSRAAVDAGRRIMLPSLRIK